MLERNDSEGSIRKLEVLSAREANKLDTTNKVYIKVLIILLCASEKESKEVERLCEETNRNLSDLCAHSSELQEELLEKT